MCGVRASAMLCVSDRDVHNGWKPTCVVYLIAKEDKYPCRLVGQVDPFESITARHLTTLKLV